MKHIPNLDKPHIVWLAGMWRVRATVYTYGTPELVATIMWCNERNLNESL